MNKQHVLEKLLQIYFYLVVQIKVKLKVSGDKATINQLMELFHQSRKRKEWVSLSLESRDGNDFVNFTIGNPAGSSAGTGAGRSWPPPWTRPRCAPLRRKTPSQQRRDQRRKEAFLAKKKANAEEKAKSDSGEECEAGDTHTSKRLVLELKNSDNLEDKSLVSPIQQLDGVVDNRVEAQDVTFYF